MVVAGALVGLVVGIVLVVGPWALAVAFTLGLAASVVALPLAPVVAVNAIVGFVVYVVWTAALYFLAVVFTGTRPFGAGRVVQATPNGERFVRGLLIGTNASGQLLFPPIAYTALVPVAPLLFGGLAVLAPVIAAYLTLLTLAAAVFPRNRTYNAFLGWSSVLSPMSWLVTGVGVLAAMACAVSAALGRPMRFFVEWWTLTFVFHGAVPAFFPTAYNLGNFSFITNEFRAQSPSPLLLTSFGLLTADGVTFHETGHTLSVGAFGPAFHYVGALDENVLGGGVDAYAEIIAESQQRAVPRPFLPLWVPPVGPTFAVNTANSAPTTGVWPSVPPPTEAAVGAVVTVDASTGVSDPDGYPLAAINPGGTPPLGFLWVFQGPAGSVAAPANDTLGVNTFIPDRGGDYVWMAAFTDGLDGTTTAGVMSVVEARANGPYVTPQGQPAALSVAGSTAGSAGALPSIATGTPLAVAWSLVSGPAGSALVNAATETATFSATSGGDATLQLTVTTASGTAHSSNAVVSVVEARANGPYAGAVDVPVALSAQGSTAGSAGALPSVAPAGASVLAVLWEIVSANAASAAIDNGSSESATVTATAPGVYLVRLTVDAGGVTDAQVVALNIS